jgi:hypothetical protein
MPRFVPSCEQKMVSHEGTKATKIVVLALRHYVSMNY